MMKKILSTNYQKSTLRIKFIRVLKNILKITNEICMQFKANLILIEINILLDSRI